MTPRRIQRRRAQGWRMPLGAVYVGRPTKWGNPFVVGRDGTAAECVDLYRAIASGYLCITKPAVDVKDQELARKAMDDAQRHADVLLEIANQ